MKLKVGDRLHWTPPADCENADPECDGTVTQLHDGRMTIEWDDGNVTHYVRYGEPRHFWDQITVQPKSAERSAKSNNR